MVTSKKLVTDEEWGWNMSRVKIQKEDMNRVVMNLFVTEGFLEVAEKFEKESLTKPQVDLSDESITDRVSINKAIRCGNVEDAIEKLNALNPEILNTNPELSFHLQKQMMIELIRDGKEEEALKFVREKLKPLAQGNEAFMRELHNTTFLLCVNEPLDISNRFKVVANKANAAILASQSREKDSILQSLLKMLIWTQSQLDEKVVYPRMNDLSTAWIELCDEHMNDELSDKHM